MNSYPKNGIRERIDRKKSEKAEKELRADNWARPLLDSILTYHERRYATVEVERDEALATIERCGLSAVGQAIVTQAVVDGCNQVVEIVKFEEEEVY